MNKTKRKEELEKLKNIKDDDIDYSDIPEINNLDNAEIGNFYTPREKQGDALPKNSFQNQRRAAPKKSL